MCKKYSYSYVITQYFFTLIIDILFVVIWFDSVNFYWFLIENKILLLQCDLLYSKKIYFQIITIFYDARVTYIQINLFIKSLNTLKILKYGFLSAKAFHGSQRMVLHTIVNNSKQNLLHFI